MTVVKTSTIRVQATASGVYQNNYYKAGDVFDIDQAFYTPATTDYSPAPPNASEYFGWMVQVADNTPLSEQSRSNLVQGRSSWPVQVY